ncbi:MAG: PH domain-containing protein [Verrucomicrobiota bacterium]
MNTEQTLFKGSSSPVINLGLFILCGLVAAASIVAAIQFTPWAWIGAGAAIAVAFSSWLLIKVRVYEITTERIRITTGILTRRTDELELYRVKDTTLVEPVVLRIFGCAHIEVTTNDASTPTIQLEALPAARDLREQLRKSVEECRDRKRVRLAELE